MSDTPRTNARSFWARTSGDLPANVAESENIRRVDTMMGPAVDWYVVSAPVAQELEREIARLESECARLGDVLSSATDVATKLTAERNEARAALKPFADLFNPEWQVQADYPERIQVGNFATLSLDDILRARAVLGDSLGGDGGKGGGG